MENRFSRLALDILFPRFCVNCGREGTLWCHGCDATGFLTSSIAACPFCGARGSGRTCAECQSETFLDGLSFFAPYANPVVREALAQWKYDTDRSIELVIKKWLFQARDRLAPPVFAFVSTAVPLHISRLYFRGFDQAEVLAEWVSELYGIPHEPLLVRIVKTSARAQVAAEERKLGALDGLFALRNEVFRVPEHVLLCDDVFTSGATMDAAARCLKEAGVKTVWGFVIAKGA